MSQLDHVLQRLMALHPRLIDLSLERMRRLLAALGHPEQRLPPTVHIAGTNGKGSTVAYLAAMAAAAGLSAHAYTSPHLVRFNERIVLGGRQIDDASLIALLERVEAANGGQPITFFEVTTAAAFLAFSEAPADLLLLEVGLGGEFDATNVIPPPLVTVITPVGMDHMEFLGPDIATIAIAKAGILKPDVPAVIGRQSAAGLATIQRIAGQVGAPLSVLGQDWQLHATADGFGIEQSGSHSRWPRPALAGSHQIDNAAVSVMVARLLAHALPQLTDAAIAAGLSRARWPGRLQRLTHGPLCDLLPPGVEVWLDGLHNPHAADALVATVRTWRDQPLSLVTGLKANRAPAAIFGPLLPFVGRVRCVTIPEEPNVHTAESLAEALRLQGVVDVAPAPSLSAAVAEAGMGGGRVLICGSLYLAGAVLADNG
ncbi:MAG: folylpolyglutamate synthase/dihydrofolate synthase family protein [Alphaproteobacteria bacterium]|nr:folylpolyglutamate synthase/dihydrofolate synthase family protein [Alphaproteobacteria bacterium]